jgi:hypothetical protein
MFDLPERLLEAPYRALIDSAKTPDDLRKNLHRAFYAYRAFRADVLRRLAILEEETGNLSTAAAYRIRLARRLPLDAHDDLIAAAELLQRTNRPLHARYIAEMVASKHFTCAPAAVQRAAQIVAETPIPRQGAADYVARLDSRQKRPYRIAQIFSLYNEERRIEQALDAYRRQAAYQRGEVELIFIDSNSPSNERAIFERLIATVPHVLYVRTKQRETLYGAWNRGIECSTAPYINFTGPSDILYTNALDLMANVLDEQPAIDWVQGNVGQSRPSHDNSAAANDGQALFDCAKNFSPLLVPICENHMTFTCSLQRRAGIHRAGPFDATFTAAGDTDYKMRFVGYGQVHPLGKVVGYTPTEDGPKLTTQPLAEIEHFIAETRHSTPEHVARIAAVNGLPTIDRADLAQFLATGFHIFGAQQLPNNGPHAAIDRAAQAATARLLAAPTASAWNDHAVTALWQTLARALDGLATGETENAQLAATRDTNRAILKDLVDRASKLQLSSPLPTSTPITLNDPFNRPYPYGEFLW